MRLPGGADVKRIGHRAHSLPGVGPAVTWARYRPERRAIAGELPASGASPSLFHFSVNKAATQYVKRLLARVGADNGVRHLRLNEYAFYSSFPYLDHLDPDEVRAHAHLFRPEGYLYSVFGGLIEGVPDFDAYRKLLVVRDPRDVLTSLYYSTAYHHPRPGAAKNDEFQADRRHALTVDVDRYALDRCEDVGDVYRRYRDGLVGRPGVLLARYEHLVGDLGTWLDEVTAFCGWTLDLTTRAELTAAAAPGAAGAEDPTRKRRQVTPGDHARKLRPDTVAQLDDRLADVLTAFGY